MKWMGFYMALTNDTVCLQGHPLQIFHLETILRINKSKGFYQLQDF